ncbi:uncharacterized protein LOC120002816 [Tripterygium wilfordii]|uniref:uncharacterized protein LOC120002816 n=1 Tax=Tripterygium wilfordii TaxID=458696 RepID=UPI0018F84C29|nr:uncharacterized protein LOC120002816 [Tripterygium wilfordii]
MGKKEKKHRHRQQRGSRRGGAAICFDAEEDDTYPSNPLLSSPTDEEGEASGELEVDDDSEEGEMSDIPSKFLLYQQSVQYVWEQAEFEIIEHKTRISLHFHLQKLQKKLHHAFSYSWRLWSLPEIKDCLEEVGFQSVHFWLRQMLDTEKMTSTEGFGVGKDVKYEEVKSFPEEDAWNALCCWCC